MAGNPQHVVLVANTEKFVHFDVNAGMVEVTNLDGTAEVYFTTNNTSATVAGEGCHVLPAAISSLEIPDGTDGRSSVVRLRSTGTPRVSVRVW
ncbi:hypothetical protein ABZ671_00810 [Micromonospora sp. NPDC006766]|uniref:hypothetical protein n=1 Tax=Micromonospora sp. NPDC006766 TaxID=3154778 RepID=UPI0033EDB164